MDDKIRRRPGRPVKYGPTTMHRLQRTLHQQIRQQLWPWETLSDYIRLALKKELQVRDQIRS
jgi:hypothetical protein